MSELYALCRSRTTEEGNDELLGMFTSREEAVKQLTNYTLYVLKLEANKVYNCEFWDEESGAEIIDFDGSNEPVCSAIP